MDAVPTLVLSAAQRRAMLQIARRRTPPSDDRAPAFRATFMRLAMRLLAALRPEQVRYLVEHHQDFYVAFEASYWQTLVDRLHA